MPSLVSVSKRPVKPSVKDVLFRDPDNSVAGEIQRNGAEWSKILDSNRKQQEIVSYVMHEVNVCEFFVPFQADSRLVV